MEFIAYWRNHPDYASEGSPAVRQGRQIRNAGVRYRPRRPQMIRKTLYLLTFLTVSASAQLPDDCPHEGGIGGTVGCSQNQSAQ